LHGNIFWECCSCELSYFKVDMNESILHPNNLIFQESERVVSKKEGIDFAREYGCLYTECSAKTRVNVAQCFDELVMKVRIQCNSSQLKKDKNREGGSEIIEMVIIAMFVSFHDFIFFVKYCFWKDLTSKLWNEQ